MKTLIPKTPKGNRLDPNKLKAYLPPLDTQESVSDPIAFLRLFDPLVDFSFYVMEGCRREDDLMMFGFFRSPRFEGMARVSLRQLERIPLARGLGLARDPLFRSARLSEIRGRS